MKLKLFVFKSALISDANDQGFAIPLVFGLGFVLLLVGMTMVFRTQGDEVNAIAQSQTAQSLGVAETGVTQTIFHLKKFAVLSTTNLSNWPTTTAALSASNSCSGGGTATTPSSDELTWITAAKTNNWINLSEGRYKVLQYQVDSRLATLELEGQMGNSTAVLEVKFPIKQVPTSVPGLWLQNVTNPPADVSTDLSIEGNVCLEGPLPSDSDKLSSVHLTGPGTLDFPPGGTPQLIPNGDQIPILPDLPSSTARYDLGSLDASNCYIMLPRIDDTQRETQDSNLKVSGLSNNCSSFNSSTSDVPSGDVYNYFFTGDDSIKLSNAQILINPPPGKRVAIYVQGKVFLSGTSSSTGAPVLTCSGTPNSIRTYIGHPNDPKKLAIYGSAQSGNADGSPNYGGGRYSEIIDISDTTLIQGFVFAPSAELKISQGQVRGAAWVKKILSSNSSGCRIAISQQDVGTAATSLANSGKNTITTVTSWKRKEAP